MKPTLTPMAAWLVRNVACTSDYEALAGDIAGAFIKAEPRCGSGSK